MHHKGCFLARICYIYICLVPPTCSLAPVAGIGATFQGHAGPHELPLQRGLQLPSPRGVRDAQQEDLLQTLPEAPPMLYQALLKAVTLSSKQPHLIAKG